MCDHDAFDDMVEYELRSKDLSRRQFGALTLGVGALSLLPRAADAAAAMSEAIHGIPPTA